MIVEIRKAGFINKGAELMLYAILAQLHARLPAAELAMAPNLKTAPYQNRAKLGLWQKASFYRYGIQWATLMHCVPRTVRKLYGIILDKEIGACLDASGFSYGDAWGDKNIVEAAKSCRRWKKQATKIVFLPQAFGPFSSQKSRDALRSIADLSDVIYAREQVSYQYIIDVTGTRSNIKISPDFTALLPGVVPDGFDHLQNQFCFVPNYRMIDKTDKMVAQKYVPFMAHCLKVLSVAGAKPFFLIHEGAKDRMLAEEIINAANVQANVVLETDPLKIKGVIGLSTGMIGSRYHGLVSALSQGVPAFATGWSHKYQMLFEDYGFSEGILSVDANFAHVTEKIQMHLLSGQVQKTKTLLDQNAAMQKQKIKTMWQEVFAILGVETNR